MFQESPPCQLKLRGGRDPVFRSRYKRGFRPHQTAHPWIPARIRGSIHIRIRSEMNVPTTVSTPSSSTMVPARNMSWAMSRSEEHTSELQSLRHLVCRLLLEKKKNTITATSVTGDYN